MPAESREREHPLNIFDTATRKIVADIAVIDARTEQRIAEIPAGGDAGDIEYDAPSHRLLAVVVEGRSSSTPA